MAALAYSRPDPVLLDTERLVVHPAHFRRGHARALLAALPPRPVAVVSTGRDNTPARTLYLGLGCTPTEDAEVVPGLWVTRFRRDAKATFATDPRPAGRPMPTICSCFEQVVTTMVGDQEADRVGVPDPGELACQYLHRVQR